MPHTTTTRSHVAEYGLSKDAARVLELVAEIASGDTYHGPIDTKIELVAAMLRNIEQPPSTVRTPYVCNVHLTVPQVLRFRTAEEAISMHDDLVANGWSASVDDALYVARDEEIAADPHRA